MRKRNKYGAIKTVIDGIKFDSKLEARRWQELKILLAAGKIANLKRQVKYPLKVNGITICTYIPDFTYINLSTNKIVIEDAKAIRTPVFNIKWKLIQALHLNETITFEIWPPKIKIRKKAQ